MMGISKRGSQHLRRLLFHGARAVVRTATRKSDARSVAQPDVNAERRLVSSPIRLIFASGGLLVCSSAHFSDPSRNLVHRFMQRRGTGLHFAARPRLPVRCRSGQQRT
jgi:hypothetical protein